MRERPLGVWPGRSRMRMTVASALLSTGLALGLVAGSPAMAAENATLSLRKAIAAPDGFADVCNRYDWACAAGSKGQVRGKALLSLAREVNNAINHQYRQVTDRSQYGTEEVWALPTSSRGGDCEDFVLAKKHSLIEAGVAPGRLLIATVLDRRRALHAVLVLRTEEGDFVLDNLNNRVKGWQETGYSFLRMQNPDAPHRWNAVFKGGMFDRART